MNIFFKIVIKLINYVGEAVGFVHNLLLKQVVFDKWSYPSYITNYTFSFNNALRYRDRLFGPLSGFKDEKAKNLQLKNCTNLQEEQSVQYPVNLGKTRNTNN